VLEALYCYQSERRQFDVVVASSLRHHVPDFTALIKQAPFGGGRKVGVFIHPGIPVLRFSDLRREKENSKWKRPPPGVMA